MKHQIKTSIFKFLAYLPGNLGMNLYHLLQNFSENKNLDIKVKSSEDTFTTFASLTQKLSIPIQNSTIIEIGSGWLPIMPYFFIYKGLASKVYTYDLNQHYQSKAISNFNAVFASSYNEDIKASSTNTFPLPEQVHYFPNQNIIKATLPKQAIVFSRFVLEHVTPNDIVAMHEKFKKELEKGSYVVHFISPSDHRAYSDSSLSLQDFLKYSQQEWDAIQTKFDYHNRLRLPQYLKIFTDLGYDILHHSFDAVKAGSKQQEMFQKLALHPDYKNYSEAELTAGNIQIVLKV